MKELIAIAMCICLAATYADEDQKARNAGIVDGKNLKERSLELFNRRTGGKIARPGSQKGRLVIVNAQKSAKPEWIRESLGRMQKLGGIDIRFAEGVFTFPEVKVEGEACLYVIDDPKMPTLLHAPEQRWTMVNVASLKAGDGEKAAFFEARCRKELVRGLSLLCGTQTSNYPNSLLLSVTKPEDLDEFVSDKLPVDIPARFQPYLKRLGITPLEMVPYVRACREGWAPAPTNDIQKAIWDKAHEIPKNPMKIEFDPKKGR